MIILASQSKARQDMLRGAGIAFEAKPADLDEAEITAQHKDKATEEIASVLAGEKALYISRQNPDALVIGSDQILECEGNRLSKADSKEEAKEKLLQLRGKTHRLISAVSLAQNGEIIWQCEEQASLTMHEFDDDFLDQYCARAGDALTSCVGAYELEDLGVQLFKTIEGDYFTILGMPLLKLLTYLREEQGVSL